MSLFQNAPLIQRDHQPNVSVPLLNPSGREVPEKSLMDKLQDAVHDCCVRIEGQIKLMLNSTDPDVIRLLQEDKFKNDFVQKVNNRYIKFALFLIQTQMFVFIHRI